MTFITLPSTINGLKTIFSRHGIPEVVRSDSGLQYISKEFVAYRFRHVTSSFLNPQNNRQGERTVQTVKKILKQSDDIYKGLLVYQSMPMPWCSLSLVELSMR